MAFDVLGKHINFEIDEVDAGTTVFDSPQGRDVTVTWVANHQDSYQALIAGDVDAGPVGSADLAQANTDAGLPMATRSISRAGSP